jgi:hypothetical protein
MNTNKRYRFTSAVYQYKRPFRDGSTHVVLEFLDFMARMAALVASARATAEPDPPTRGVLLLAGSSYSVYQKLCNSSSHFQSVSGLPKSVNFNLVKDCCRPVAERTKLANNIAIWHFHS